jgi:anti-sigma factor RsiW
VSCQDTRKLIHAYADGELDAAHSVDVERHLRECPACAGTYTSLQALRTALGEGGLYFKPAPGLRERVRASLPQVSAGGAARKRPLVWPWVGMAASLAAGAALTWGLTTAMSGSTAGERLIQEVVAAHARSRLARHLTDVSSSDEHTVKPWLSRKLTFAPLVPDLARKDFTLVGGRLDYLDGRAVAALVYLRRQHVINLFLWPSERADREDLQALTRQGFHLAHWTRGGMTFWAVSDLNEKELGEFARLVQKEQGLER